jgi:hypothetical protein
MADQTVESDAWAVISNLRDQHPRVPNDCPTEYIVDALAAAGLLASPAVPAERCPRCDSPDPAKHPAVQFEGEVSICPDLWHSPAVPAGDEAGITKAIYAGWHEFRYPRPAVDEPSDSFKRGVCAALAALREGKK